MEIIQGSTLRIGEDLYDVLRVMKEIDKYDAKANRLVGEHLEVTLHKIGEKSLLPTHILKLYSKKAVIMKMSQEKIDYVKNPRQRGVIFNYLDGTEIPLDSITLENKK
jgi:hypothetical protein